MAHRKSPIEATGAARGGADEHTTTNTPERPTHAPERERQTHTGHRTSKPQSNTQWPPRTGRGKRQQDAEKRPHRAIPARGRQPHPKTPRSHHMATPGAGGPQDPQTQCRGTGSGSLSVYKKTKKPTLQQHPNENKRPFLIGLFFMPTVRL